MQRAVETGAQAFVEDLFDLAQSVPPRRVQNHKVTAAQFLDRLQQVIEMHVAVASRPLAVSRAVERALDEQHLRRENLRSGFEDAGAGVGAVGEEMGREFFGDDLSGAAAAGDFEG